MQTALTAESVVYVDLLKVVQLQAVKPQGIQRKLLYPAEESYEFFFVRFEDGRPEKEWAVLTSDQGFGLPVSRLRSLDRANAIEVTNKAGKRHYS